MHSPIMVHILMLLSIPRCHVVVRPRRLDEVFSQPRRPLESSRSSNFKLQASSFKLQVELNLLTADKAGPADEARVLFKLVDALRVVR